jgi:entry exclusion lipoprotein TrbK
MRKIAGFFLIIGFLGLVGCSDETENYTMPEVNNENCRHENVAKLEPTDLREKFASLCLKRNKLRPTENPKSWGPADLY